jgi:hypothetical protein
MLLPESHSINAHDLTAIIDPVGYGIRCALEIDLGEDAIVKEKAMLWAIVIDERAHDLAEIIDAEDIADCRALGAIERSEGAIIPEEAMLCSIVIPESARDLAIIIDPSSFSNPSTRSINLMR